MAGELAAQVRPPQKVEVDPIHLRRNNDRIIIAHLHVAIECQGPLRKLRMAGHVKHTGLRGSFKVEVSRQFAVEREIVHLNRGFYFWRFGCARDMKSEVGAPFDAQVIELNLADRRECQFCPERSSLDRWVEELYAALPVTVAAS